MLIYINNLYKYTQLQSSFGINNIALVDGRPEALSLKKALEVYIAHQLDVITRRTNFELDEDLKRMHILEGFIIATDHIDEIIKIIRNSMNGEEKDLLIQRFNLFSLIGKHSFYIMCFPCWLHLRCHKFYFLLIFPYIFSLLHVFL